MSVGYLGPQQPDILRNGSDPEFLAEWYFKGFWLMTKTRSLVPH